MSLLPPDEGPTQGARAGRSGRFLEERIKSAFKQFKVKVVKDDRSFHYPDLYNRTEKLLIEQPMVKGIKPDFLYIDYKRNIRLPAECKQQVGSGSTDQKLYYTIYELIGLARWMTEQYQSNAGYWLIVSGQGFSQKVMHKVQNEIIKTNKQYKINGHLVYDEILFRAIESLVERGQL